MTTSELTIRRYREARLAVLQLSGCLDLPGASALLATAGELGWSGVRFIICDLEDLEDVADHTLLTVFAAAQRRVGIWPGHSVHLTGASAVMSRRLRQLSLHRFLGVHGTLGDALRVIDSSRDIAYEQLSLAPFGSSPAMARALLGRLPWAGAARDDQDAAALVVSELASNAVRHVREPFTVDLALTTGELLVTVTDPSRQEPILRPIRATSAGGRGMQLVDALSRSWGVRLIHDGGKTVWARLSLAA